MEMVKVKYYLDNLRYKQNIKLETLISELVNDIKKYGGNCRIIDLREVKQKIGYDDLNIE